VLAVVPAVLGVLAVAALAYWGQYGRQAPSVVIVVAVIAAVGSLVVAWRNTRYVAQRVERLARASRDAGGADELDTIESTVQQLNLAVDSARADGARRERAAEERAREHEALLDDVMSALSHRLEEAQLPLHILLSSPFGALNENQEEMLGAAHSAVEQADGELRTLQKLVALDRGAVTPMRAPIGIGELLRPALAIAESRADRAQVQLASLVSDTAPRVLVDRVLTQEALTVILTDAVTRAPASGVVQVDAAEAENGCVAVRVTRQPASDGGPLELRLAQRTLELQGAIVREQDGRLVVELGCERPR
jgi:hypothetical protein